MDDEYGLVSNHVNLLAYRNEEYLLSDQYDAYREFRCKRSKRSDRVEAHEVVFYISLGRRVGPGSSRSRRCSSDDDLHVLRRRVRDKSFPQDQINSVSRRIMGEVRLR